MLLGVLGPVACGDEENLEEHAFHGKPIERTCYNEVGVLEVFDLDDTGSGTKVEGYVVPRSFAKVLYVLVLLKEFHRAECRI